MAYVTKRVLEDTLSKKNSSDDYMEIITQAFQKSDMAMKEYMVNPSTDLVREMRINHGRALICFHKMLDDLEYDDNSTCIKVSTCRHIITLMENIIDKCDQEESDENRTTMTTDKDYTFGASSKDKIPLILNTDKGLQTFYVASEKNTKIPTELENSYNRFMSDVKKNKPGVFITQPLSARPTERSTTESRYSGVLTPNLSESGMIEPPFDITKPTLLLVHGKSWCKGSKNFYENVWTKLKNKLADKDINLLQLSVNKNDNDEKKQIMEKLGITTVPMLYLFENGTISVLSNNTFESIMKNPIISKFN